MPLGGGRTGFIRRADRPSWHPDDCNGKCCWRKEVYVPPPGGAQRRDDADWEYCSNRCGRYVSGRTTHFWMGAWMGRGAALHTWLCDACYRAALAWEHQQEYRARLERVLDDRFINSAISTGDETPW